MPMQVMSNPQANAAANPLSALSSLGSMGKSASHYLDISVFLEGTVLFIVQCYLCCLAVELFLKCKFRCLNMLNIRLPCRV